MLAISLSPNTQSDDVLLALGIMLAPWRWFRGGGIKGLEDWFKRYFKVGFAIAFDSGRSAEYAILKAIGLKAGDEVLIQAFTCVAVPNSILWTGASPIYVDIDDSCNLDPSDLKAKITKRSKAVIIQHTFGVAANIEAIKKIAKKHKLILIEDCAHALGASYEGRKLGTFGDFAFFSFGRDKVVSCVFGGMVITNSKKRATPIRNFQRLLPFPKASFVLAQLFHPIAFILILPLYNLAGIGKVLLVLLQKLGFLTKVVEIEEKRGERPSFYPRRLANAQAVLTLHQLKKLPSFIVQRRAISNFYRKVLSGLPVALPKLKPGDVPLRYNMSVEQAPFVYRFFKAKGILLGRWYANVIDPQDVDLAKIGYERGLCPRAEGQAAVCLNLPTYPKMTLTDAAKVVGTLREYFFQHHA